MEEFAKVGQKGRLEITVSESNTAASLGSGLLPVFGTPALVSIMEGAALNSFTPPAGMTSVGTKISVEHISATPVGMRVWAEAVITGVEGRRLEFDVVAYDEAGIIGRGKHERFVVEPVRFMEKAESKLKGEPGARQ